MSTRTLGFFTALVAVSGLLLASGLFSQGCFVDGRCIQDDDCGAGRFCEQGPGVCVAKECDGDQACGAGEMCSRFRCVATGTSAPAFELADINPRSATHGEIVRLADFRGQVLLVYFANAT